MESVSRETQLQDVMSISNTTKQITVCQEHGQNKEYFHVSSRQMLCPQCLSERKIQADDCVSSRQYCSDMMQRYITLLDNATYMPTEHVQKEKEYGIQWRTAFKREMISFADAVARRMIRDEGFDEADDPLLFFHQIVKKDAIDASTFDTMTQADLMSMMIENLEILEKSLYQIKAMLKERDITKFESTKEKAMVKIREDQKKYNPGRPDTTSMNRAIANQK